VFGLAAEHEFEIGLGAGRRTRSEQGRSDDGKENAGGNTTDWFHDIFIG
jgi:hypothetical protein